MKGLKMFLVIFISFTIFSMRVDAVICDNEDVARLKELASHVYADYEYIDSDSGDESEGDIKVFDTYSVSVFGLTQELYVLINNEKYYFDSVEAGVLDLVFPSGTIDFSVYSTRCDGVEFHNFSVTLPKFNTYSLREECKQLKDLDLEVCDEWYQGSLNDITFNAIVDKYLSEEENKSSISEFFQNYYLFMIGVILLVVIIIIAFFRHRKRSVLE